MEETTRVARFQEVLANGSDGFRIENMPQDLTGLYARFHVTFDVGTFFATGAGFQKQILPPLSQFATLNRATLARISGDTPRNLRFQKQRYPASDPVLLSSL